MKRAYLAAHQDPPLTTHLNPSASSSSRAAWSPPKYTLTHTPGSEGCGDTSSMGLVMVAQLSVGLMTLDGRRGVWIAWCILALLPKEWVSRADCALPTAGKRIRPTPGMAAELEEKQEHYLILQVSRRLIPSLNQPERSTGSIVPEHYELHVPGAHRIIELQNHRIILVGKDL